MMLKVPPTQTLQAYKSMVDDAGLDLAPGYVQVTLPEDEHRSFTRGSQEWFRWFDDVRRRAEESNFCGLDSVFIASDIRRSGRVRVDEAVAVGAAFDQGRLERVTELLADAVEVLAREGLRAGLHNHVGTWIETKREIEYVLDNVDSLWAGFDIGHLSWAGMDPVEMVRKYSDRLLDLHIKDLDARIATASRAVPTSYREASVQRFFLEPGSGDIDLAGVLAELPSNFPGWVVVEVDRASIEPTASAKQSWRWIEDHVPARVV